MEEATSFNWNSSAEKMIPHEKYSPGDIAYDIGLIKMKDPAPLNC